MAASWIFLPILNKPLQLSVIAAQIESLTSQLVGNRPNRVEPRAVKRRPKPHRLLKMLRNLARELPRRGIDPYEKQK